MPNTTKKVYCSKEAYANLSPEKKAKRLAQMKSYYLKNKDAVLARHNLRNANEKRFKCQACDKYYKSNYNLNSHYNSNKHKKNVRLKTEGNRPNNENNGKPDEAKINRAIEVS